MKKIPARFSFGEKVSAGYDSIIDRVRPVAGPVAIVRRNRPTEYQLFISSLGEGVSGLAKLDRRVFPRLYDALDAVNAKFPVTLGVRAAQAYFDSSTIGPAPIARDEIPVLAKVIDKVLREAGLVQALDDLIDEAQARGASPDDETTIAGREAVSVITGIRQPS